MLYDPQDYSSNLKILFQQMKMYETTNSNFQYENLVEQSIWSPLYAEQICSKTNPPMNERLQKIILTAALLHNIGKMSPPHCVPDFKRHKYIYNEIQEYGSVGSKEVKVKKPISITTL